MCEMWNVINIGNVFMHSYKALRNWLKTLYARFPIIAYLWIRKELCCSISWKLKNKKTMFFHLIVSLTVNNWHQITEWFRSITCKNLFEQEQWTSDGETTTCLLLLLNCGYILIRWVNFIDEQLCATRAPQIWVFVQQRLVWFD